MKGERIFIADDQSIVVDGLRNIIRLWGRDDDHQIVGEANSVEGVEKAFKGGMKPTVALVDEKFPSHGDGLRAAQVIRKESPTTKIIQFSTDPKDWGKFQDAQWNKYGSTEDLIIGLTNLEH